MMTIFASILILRVFGRLRNITKGVEKNIQASSTKQLLFVYKGVPTIQGRKAAAFLVCFQQQCELKQTLV